MDASQTNKTKKAKAASVKPTTGDIAATPISNAQPAAPKPTDSAETQANPKVKPRKRAVDFLSDDEEKDGGVSVDKTDDVGTSSSRRPRKKKSKKDKAGVNGEASGSAMHNDSAAQRTAIATKASGDAPAGSKLKEAKPKPKMKEISTTDGGIVSSPVPKRGPSTIKVHAEKIKKLLGQKDHLPKQSNKAKEAANVLAMDFTTDGVNGVSSNTTNESLETVAKDAASTSMQAEAQRTTETELREEYESDEDIDQAGALLEGFDSDNEDLAQDEGFDKDKPTAAIPNYKKTQKKLRQAARNGNKGGPGAVYVGRIPHGFYENEMRQYFSQFGNISKLRLSRNRKTGHSKHFAFIEFESNEVAKIVAETMDNYLMFGHILKCKYAQPESLHPDTFKGANKRFRVAPHNRMEKRALEAPKSESQWAKKNSKEQLRREKKAEKLKAMGYEIELPRLKSPSEVLQQKESQNAVEGKGPDAPKGDDKEVPSPSVVPKDEAALSKKKSKKRKMPDPSKSEGNDVSAHAGVPQDEIVPSKKQSKEEKNVPVPSKSEGNDVSAHAGFPQDEIVPSKKKSEKEKNVPDPSKADGENPPAPTAVAKEEVASGKKKSKKVGKDNTATTETDGVTVPTADLNALTPDPVQSQNSVKENPEKRNKRKEKRHKAKDNAKQLHPQSITDENPSKTDDQPTKPESDATIPTPGSAMTDQSSKQKEKDKNGIAQATIDETSAEATTDPRTTSVEKETSSSMLHAESAEGIKKKRRSRKRKSSTTAHELAESEPRAMEPAVADPQESKVNGEPRAESTVKKTKKAKKNLTDAA